jgi:HEAT repeat protein
MIASFALRRRAAWPAVGTAGLAALLPIMGGCQSERVQPGQAINSLFELVNPDTPAQAAKDMVDPFDANRRFRGMSRISAAPWGGEEVYVNIYADAVQRDEDPGVRAVAARALGNHGRPEHVPLILPLLTNDDPRVRLEAARALQRLHNPVAIPKLGELLVGRPDPNRPRPNPRAPIPLALESNKDVRAAAAEALAQYADPLAAQTLLVALGDDDLLVARTARLSLRTMTGQDFGPEPEPWRTFLSGPSPFAGRLAYTYPAYQRDRYTWEYIPLWPDPPNEARAAPAGYEPPSAQ